MGRHAPVGRADSSSVGQASSQSNPAPTRSRRKLIFLTLRYVVDADISCHLGQSIDANRGGDSRHGPCTPDEASACRPAIPPLAIGRSYDRVSTKIGNGPRAPPRPASGATPARRDVEHWLTHQLNTYLQDLNKHRATTRHLLQPSGIFTYIPHTFTVRLDRPTSPNITRALSLLADNSTPTPHSRRPPLHAPSPHHDQTLTVAATLPVA